MLDPRIYRAAFLPVIAALAALMFSLEEAPQPLEGPISTPVFKGRESARLARSIATLAPVRTPGSVGDIAVADQVKESFGSVTGGEVSEQSFEVDGQTAENVILTLPGLRPETLLVLAARDSEAGAGATTSAAATATLLTLADTLGSSRHERTIVLASVSATADGTEGVRQLIDQLPVERGIEAAIVIQQPGVEERLPPFAFPGRAGTAMVPPTLIGTATEIATVQFGEPAYPIDGWQAFSRLALPVGIGPSAALADEGVDAISISGSGERPPDPDSSLPEDVSSETMFMVGSSALGLLLTLDEAKTGIEGGPAHYIKIGDNLLPGWPLSVLALALILPALLAAGDVWLRDRRRNPRATRRSIPWVLERGLLPLAALLVAYLFGLVGLIPRPDFPYDPGRFGAGGDGPVTLAVILLAIALAALLIRPLRTPLDAEPQTLAAAAGLTCSVAVLGIWLLNPFMALLLVPAAHVWLLPARAQGPPRSTTIAIFALISLIPILLAGAEVAGSLDLGISALWQLLLLIGSGQISILIALLWCLLIGGLLAAVVAARARLSPELIGARGRTRGPSGYAGPGSLGGTPSSLPRA